MTPPPEALAVGWPAAFGLGVALAVVQLRERRRRASLEAAIHELRRPLQAMTLAPPRCSRIASGSCLGPGGGYLGGALDALRDLERAVSDREPALRLRPMSLRPLLEAALERCHEHHANLSWAAGDACVLADPVRLGRALDNLLENALEHGQPPTRVDASIGAAGVRLVISNAIAPGGPRRATRTGRGQGLKIVASTARAHGGRFLFDRDERRATALLELPLAPRPLPAATRFAAEEPALRPRAGAG
jgi:signal transduction histidine kinase